MAKSEDTNGGPRGKPLGTDELLRMCGLVDQGGGGLGIALPDNLDELAAGFGAFGPTIARIIEAARKEGFAAALRAGQAGETVALVDFGRHHRRPGLYDDLERRVTSVTPEDCAVDRHPCAKETGAPGCERQTPDWPLAELRDRIGRLRLEDFLEPVQEAHADRLARIRRINRKIKRALRGLDEQSAAVQAIIEDELLRRA